MSTVIPANIQTWRQKVRDDTITMEEMRDAIAAIRGERLGASNTSDASRERKSTAKAKAAPVDSDALLRDLGL